LAAWALKGKEKDLEFGIGAHGPEVRDKLTKKSINYWALANLVNVNNAGIAGNLWDVTLNCRHVYHAPFQSAGCKAQVRKFDSDVCRAIHVAVIEVDRETFQPRFWLRVCR